MAHCFGNKETAVYCRYMKTVDVDPHDEHKIVERTKNSWSCAWCFKHNCPCKDLDYLCSDIELVQGYFDNDDNQIETPYEQYKK